MRVLVTGGAGFIGSHFARRLVAAGDAVVVLDKLTYAGSTANLDGVGAAFVQGDIADPEAVSEAGAGCDAIVNFAAETHVDRSILEGGDFLRNVRTYGVDALITRGSNTYGPRQYPEKILPLFVTNALDGAPLPLYGDGTQVRDWLYVEDHCAGIELALREGAAGEVYNVGGGEEVENREITRRVLELTGADESLVRRVDDRPGHDRRYSLDTSKLQALGWTRRWTLAEGLPATVAWYREHRAWWERIKQSDDYRAYYETQYAARLG